MVHEASPARPGADWQFPVCANMQVGSIPGNFLAVDVPDVNGNYSTWIFR